jgi:hypothetical protein
MDGKEAEIAKQYPKYKNWKSRGDRRVLDLAPVDKTKRNEDTIDLFGALPTISSSHLMLKGIVQI